MIASLFSKTRPINYILSVSTLVVCFFIYQINHTKSIGFDFDLIQKAAVLLLLLGSYYLINFFSLKNALTKNDNYATFLFVAFLLMFPSLFNNLKIVISNFFLILALRNLISLKNISNPKEDIFNASFWIFVAAIFHFWSIFYFILVIISILYTSGKDYRNWLLPIIAFLCVVILYIFFSLLIFNGFVFDFKKSLEMSFVFSTNQGIYQNMAISIMVSISTLFFISQILDLPHKPLNMQTSFKQINFSFILAAGIYILSTQKSNDLMIYTFAPLSILGSNMFSKMQEDIYKDVSLYLLLGLGILFFALQL